MAYGDEEIKEKVQLRTFVYIDSMQPQYAAITGTIVSGSVPVEGMAELYIEVAPGIAVYRLLDVALKGTDVKPGFQIVEREFGAMEIHASSQSSVKEAARAILSASGLSETDCAPPEVVTAEVITKVDAYQAQLINRSRRGALLLPGESLYIMEVKPAGFIVYAANEAEKAANIKIIEYRSIGRFGRLYVGGPESEVQAARRATIDAIEAARSRYTGQ